jgi:hypothetical protein
MNIGTGHVALLVTSSGDGGLVLKQKSIRQLGEYRNRTRGVVGDQQRRRRIGIKAEEYCAVG